MNFLISEEKGCSIGSGGDKLMRSIESFTYGIISIAVDDIITNGGSPISTTLGRRDSVPDIKKNSKLGIFQFSTDRLCTKRKPNCRSRIVNCDFCESFSRVISAASSSLSDRSVRRILNE